MEHRNGRIHPQKSPRFAILLLLGFPLWGLAGCKSGANQKGDAEGGMEVLTSPSPIAGEFLPAVSEDDSQDSIPAPVPDAGVVPDGTYLLKNVMSGKCLEFSDSGKISDPPRQYPCRGTSPQQFVVKRLGAGNRYSLQNVSSGKYLQVKGRSTENGGQTEQAALGSDIVQEFAFDGKAEAQYAIRSLFSSKILTVADNLPDDAVEILQWDYLGYTNQVWQLTLKGTVDPLP